MQLTFQTRVGTLHNQTLEAKIAALSNVKALVSSDDETEIVNAVWMPPESPLIILRASEGGPPSAAVSFLEKVGRKVIFVQETAPPKARDADPELEEQDELIGPVPWDDEPLLGHLHAVLHAL
jgi:hypothetical protein